MSKLKKNDPIKTIMTKNPTTITTDTPLSEVGKIFHESFYHHLPVVSGSKLTGIVSYSDFLKVWFGDAFDQDERQVNAVLDNTKSVSDIMSKSPETIKSSELVKDAAQHLKTGKFHALPVVEDGEELVGIVTSRDLIEYLYELY